MTRRLQQYPPELRERAVRMVMEVIPNYDSQWAEINAVAQKLGVGTGEDAVGPTPSRSVSLNHYLPTPFNVALMVFHRISASRARFQFST